MYKNSCTSPEIIRSGPGDTLPCSDSVSSGSHSRSALLYLSLLLSTIRPPETIGTMVWKKSPSRDLKALSAQGTLREVHYVSQMKTGVWKIIRHFYVDQTENIGTHML
jgi:hypothetical protein